MGYPPPPSIPDNDDDAEHAGDQRGGGGSLRNSTLEVRDGKNPPRGRNELERQGCKRVLAAMRNEDVAGVTAERTR